MHRKAANIEEESFQKISRRKFAAAGDCSLTLMDHPGKQTKQFKVKSKCNKKQM